jgi:hypothetical protein
LETNLTRTSPTKVAAVGLLSEANWLHPLQGTPYMHGSGSCGYHPLRNSSGCVCFFFGEALHQHSGSSHAKSNDVLPLSSIGFTSIARAIFHICGLLSIRQPTCSCVHSPFRALKKNCVVGCNSWLDGAAKLFC